MTEPAADCIDEGVLADLALGFVTGEERWLTLAHVGRCASCSARLAELLDVADRTLAAAPAAEPPVGFESQVVRAMTSSTPGRRRRVIGLAAAALLLIAVAVGGALAARDGGADPVREAQMMTASGRDVGSAWLHTGDAPWLFLSVPGWNAWEGPDGSASDYSVAATLDDGAVVELGSVRFAGYDASWAGTITVDADRITEIAVVDDDGRVWCEGRF